jgi:hypothetical protein
MIAEFRRGAKESSVVTKPMSCQAAADVSGPPFRGFSELLGPAYHTTEYRYSDSSRYELVELGASFAPIFGLVEKLRYIENRAAHSRTGRRTPEKPSCMLLSKSRR